MVGWVPGVVGEGGQGFAKLGADDGEGVIFVVAMLMKRGGLELVLGGSEKESELLGAV